MIDEKRVNHMRDKLYALSQYDYGKMRSHLRSLASPIFAEHYNNNDVDITDIKHRCTHATMPSYKPTVSGVIMACSIPALFDIIFNSYGCTNVLDAILDPTRYGFPNSKTHSGYDFGRGKEVSDELHQERLRWIAGTKSMSSLAWTAIDADEVDCFDANALGASAMLAIVSKTCLLTDYQVETNDIVMAMKVVFENFGDTWDTTDFEAKIHGLDALMENEPLVAREFTDKYGQWERQAQKLAEKGVPFNGIVTHVVYHLAQMRSPIGLKTEPTSKRTSVSDIVKKASKDSLNLVNMTLKTVGLANIEQLSRDFDESERVRNDIEAQLKDMESRLSRMSVTSIKPSEVKASGEIPSGKQVTKKAHEVFDIPSSSKKMFDFDILVWEWDSPHPYVPEIDHGYVFRPSSLLRVLHGLVTNQRIYIHGHTGSGKTTLVEQICARLLFPFMRVNFDSEVTRMDLLGRDVLTTGASGATESKFVEGILPKMMSTPCIGCFDEIDFIRPDVAYVMQRAFEGHGLMLTDDGGRVVQPHPQFRMIATGNTVGQGDEFGMYQGARPQSMAMIDRFTIWVSVPYLDIAQRDQLIKNKVPALKDEQRDQLNKYVEEHLEAFTTSKVLQPISPRGMLSLADTMVAFTTLFNSRDATKEALEAVILDRCTQQDRAVLKGIVNRIFT